MEFGLYSQKMVKTQRDPYVAMVGLFLISIGLSYYWTHDTIKHDDIAPVMTISSMLYLFIKLSVKQKVI